VRHQLDGLRDGRRLTLQAWLIGLVLDVLGAGVGSGGELHILGDVDHHRTGPARAGDVERLVQHAGQVIDVADQPVVLGAGPGDADRVALLEGVIADQMGRHLARYADHGNRIHQRIGEAGDGVGGTRTRSHEHHPDLAGRARISLGGVHRTALLAHQDVLDLVLLEQLVIDRQHRPAGIAEHVLDPLVGQRPDDHFGARHLQCHVTNSTRRPVTGRIRRDLYRGDEDGSTTKDQ
jgi:hypothetical protein